MGSGLRVAGAVFALSLGLTACAGATSDPTAAPAAAGGSTGGGTEGGAGEGGGTEPATDGPLTIGMTIHQADVYFQTIQDALTGAVEADGGQVIAVNTQTDPSTEASAVQDFIARGVDAMVLSPLSQDGSLASVEAAVDAGIPVVCYNTCLSPEATEEFAVAFIESDQEDLGRQTGDFARTYLEEQGPDGPLELGILNCDRYEACQARKEGFLAAIEGLDYTIVADQEALQPDEAASRASDILTASPGVDVMWAASQGATEGLVVAAGGREGTSIFGTDVSPSLVQSILDGELTATTGQDSVQTGQLSYEAVQAAVAGEEVEEPSVALPGVLYAEDDTATLEQYLEDQGAS